MAEPAPREQVTQSFSTLPVDEEGRPPGDFEFRSDEPTTTLTRIDYGAERAVTVGKVDLAGALEELEDEQLPVETR